MQSINLDMDDFYDRDGFDDEPFAEEAEEVPDPDERRRRRAGRGDDDVPTDEQVLAGMDKTLPKRRTTKPQPKLDEKRLCSETGFTSLPVLFKDWKPNPKKDEYGNLCSMMNKLEHWAHRLYPKLKFDDFLARVEQLGDKRPVKTQMQKLRMDMPLRDDDFAAAAADDGKNGDNDAMDADDGNSQLATSAPTTAAAANDDDYDPFADAYGDSSPPSAPPSFSSDSVNALPAPSQQTAPTASTMTDEQRQRMEANRLRAIELRQKRLEYYARLDTANAEAVTSSDTNERLSTDPSENRETSASPIAPMDAPPSEADNLPPTQPAPEPQLLDEDDVMMSLCDGQP
uniref:TIMELESS-interacting protein n=1 Tax=Plectus sambesii TaxID=2011161 RepID=A0A914WM12_9BILA